MRPDWFLDELMGFLAKNRLISVHYIIIHREFECARVSLKKLRIISKERDENLRADFIRQIGKYSVEELGFLDEFLKDERTCRCRNGRSKRGQELQCEGYFFVDGGFRVKFY